MNFIVRGELDVVKDVRDLIGFGEIDLVIDDVLVDDLVFVELLASGKIEV